MSDNKRVILRTYGNAWNFEKKIYSVGDFNLPFPLNLTQLGYFGIGMLLVFLLAKAFPVLENIPMLVYYVVVPFGFTKLLTRVKFHGKSTIAWLRGFSEHLFAPIALERYQPVEKGIKGTFENVGFRRGYKE